MSPPSGEVRLHTPDGTLLRRFGLIRAVGGGAYIVAVLVLLVVLGWRVWPLALGVPILAVVTTWYFVSSDRYPRTAVMVSLGADAVVLGGAVSYVGGSGSGLVMLYAIPVVSAGILLGPASAWGFTALGIGLGFFQLTLEQVGLAPALLHRAALDERVPILLASLAGLASVGYLSGAYAGQLHELIADAGSRADVALERGVTRQRFVEHARSGMREPLARLEAIAQHLERADALAAGEPGELAAALRVSTTQLDAEVEQVVDLGILDAVGSTRPQPLLLGGVVDDCIAALGDRLAPYRVERKVPAIKVLGDARAARRVVFNLLENVVEHTPPGTNVRIAALAAPGQGVLAITDDGPGVPAELAASLFAPPFTAAARTGAASAVGLPLVRELCRAMGGEVRYEPAPGGGARFLMVLRLAPASAPAAEERDPAGDPADSGSAV
jgi:two-component system, OmpR family, sensor kinase